MPNPVKRLTIGQTPIEKFAIVLSQNPTHSEEYAATRLQTYLKKATGASLFLSQVAPEHSIFIGSAAQIDRSELKHDGFAIQTDGQNLHLAGAIDRGTIYAVNTFLEKYVGVRIYAPGVERILPSEAVEIPSCFKEVQNPVFSYRATDWITHVTDPDFAVWEKLSSSRSGILEDKGGSVSIIGGCHTFERLCPPKQYFDEHPEYYSLWEGKRIPAGNVFDVPVGQLCLSNPDVVKIVTENVLQWIEANPGCQVVDVSQNDNQHYCQCENCAAIDEEEGTPAGSLIRFVNQVAAAVAEKHPGVLVQTFAYQYTRKAPKITKPADNVMIRLCSIEACFRHKLDHGCEHNIEQFSQHMESWSKLAKHLSIWDYTTNYECYLAPFPNLWVLRDNVRYFADNNALHVFEEDTPGTNTGEFGPMRAYLIARLLWNPYMSEEEFNYHMDDFLEGYFGPGWESLKEYLEILKKTTEDFHIRCFEPVYPISPEPFNARYDYVPFAYQDIRGEHYLTPFMSHLPKLKALWANVLDKARDDAERERILRARMSLDYMELFCTPHIKEEMTESEQAEYEAAVAEFLKKKERFGIHTNLFTAEKWKR